MTERKTAVTPLLTHWSYCNPALSHRYHDGPTPITNQTNATHQEVRVQSSTFNTSATFEHFEIFDSNSTRVSKLFRYAKVRK